MLRQPESLIQHLQMILKALFLHRFVNYSTLLRIVFRENYGYSNEYQSVHIKVLLHQNIQCINILAQALDTQYVGYVCMTMSRTKLTCNQFYNC